MAKIALFDAGNTALKVSIASNSRPGKVAIHQNSEITAKKLVQALRSTAREPGLEGAIACSVSPSNGMRLREAWRSVSRIPLLFLNHRMKLPVNLKYPQPATIGPDRLAAASASYMRIKGAHIVIDAGTAITFDCIDAKGRFMGGAIAPGPDVMSEYLYSNTGLLPGINYSGSVPKIGRSTEGAMRIGVRVGYGAMLKAIVGHLREGAFAGMDVPIILTGGFAKNAYRETGRTGKVIENLTMEGLAIIYDMNM